VTDASSRTVVLHGRRAAYHRSGEGPTVVLVHGIAGGAAGWAPVVPHLSADVDVVVPDLPGHGESDRLRGDHSIGAYATWLRDLLEAIEVERATFVGHSLGGGIVMQFAYQFPQYVERMVLVSSGGLGREVTLAIRAAGLPGAGPVIAALGGAAAWARPLVSKVLDQRRDAAQLLEHVAGLAHGDRRAAFIRAVRAVTSPAGQRVSAGDRLYLAADVPTLIVWGGRDRIIPVAHAHSTAAAIPGSRLVVVDHAGHFPHLDDPARFADEVRAFLRDTPAVDYDPVRLRRRLLAGAPPAGDAPL
jgi:pimeloyl-ACP methyl ester carboxylesterase